MNLYRMGSVLLVVVLTMMVTPAWCQDASISEAPRAAAPPDEASEDPSMAVQSGVPSVESSSASVVQIEDAVVCQDVVDRTPVGAGDQFDRETARVYCFCRVVGAQAGSRITHNWYFNGVLKASVELKVGSADFRTWSSKTLQPEQAGEWMVEILSDDGKPLESIVFMIK